MDEKKVQTNPELSQVFAQVVEDFTAGDPGCDQVRWISLKPSHLRYKLAQRNAEVSLYLIGQLLQQAGLRKRSYLKSACLDQVPQRDEQFNKITSLKAYFLRAGWPVLSMDTKKKEMLGNFHRQGHYYDQAVRAVNDHDFNSYPDGQIIPHGLYDLADNFGYLTLGKSKDTAPRGLRLLSAITWLTSGQVTCSGSTLMPIGCSCSVMAGATVARL